MKKIVRHFFPPDKWWPYVFWSAGVICGIIAYLFYVSKAYSYLSDDPKTCINCHVMSPYYATFQHSSHKNAATCNDCHVPHENVVKKYFFKAKDGLYHASVFTMRGEPQVIQIKEAGINVVQKNCQRCHDHVNENVATGKKINLEDRNHGAGKLCWDCHREVPHGTVSGLSITPDAPVPLNDSPVPEWLHKMMNEPDKSK